MGHDDPDRDLDHESFLSRESREKALVKAVLLVILGAEASKAWCNFFARTSIESMEFYQVATSWIGTSRLLGLQDVE